MRADSKAKPVLECTFALPGVICAKFTEEIHMLTIFPGAERADRMFIRTLRSDRRARRTDSRHERDFEGKPPTKLYLH